MNDREIATLQSYDKTVDLCTKKSPDFGSLPLFSEYVTELGVLAGNLRRYNHVLEVSTEGFTNAKNTAKESLLNIALPVLARVQAYAKISRDEVLQNAVKITGSMLKRLKESLLGSKCRGIFDICQERYEAIAPYGLTPEMLAAFEAAINDFEIKLKGSPQYRGEQKAARQNFDNDFAAANDLVKNKMDVLVEIIKDINPSIYIEYWNSRKLELSGSRTLAMKCRVTDGATNQPIEGVTVNISKNESDDTTANASTEAVKMAKRTTAKGAFQVKMLPTGTYTLTAGKEGYATQTLTVVVNDSETSEVEVVMGKG